jgi:cobaltochelatase CobN
MKRVSVELSSGKRINVVPHRGHLFVCGLGCCCGKAERGFAPAFLDLYHREWERRKLRNHVHLTPSGCLGPCALANVVLLLFAGEAIWFHSFNQEAQIIALYDYIEHMIQDGNLLPIPPSLRHHVFQGFVDAPDKTVDLVVEQGQ